MQENQIYNLKQSFGVFIFHVPISLKLKIKLNCISNFLKELHQDLNALSLENCCFYKGKQRKEVATIMKTSQFGSSKRLEILGQPIIINGPSLGLLEKQMMKTNISS